MDQMKLAMPLFVLSNSCWIECSLDHGKMCSKIPEHRRMKRKAQQIDNAVGSACRNIKSLLVTTLGILEDEFEGRLKGRQKHMQSHRV